MNLANGIDEQVERLYKQCTTGDVNPYLAAVAIDETIGGLTRVDYDPNKTLRVYNHTMQVKLNHRGLDKRERSRMEELVVIMHHVAQQKQKGFDPTKASKICFEKDGTVISTKHHTAQFRQYQQQVVAKYAA